MKSRQPIKLVVTLLLAFTVVTSVISDTIRLDAQAQPLTSTVMGVYPQISLRNPGEFLTILVNVTEVTDLYTWAFQLRWKRGLLECIQLLEETSFFDGDFAGDIDNPNAQVSVGSTLFGNVPGETGGGRLARIRFQVLDTGNCTLDLFNTDMINSAGGHISHSVEDGIFYTNYPRAKFTYSTTFPVTGENVTFNASSSYDPDGIIVSYDWDFGDGSYGTGVVTTHAYVAEGSYTVSLQVIDNDGFSDTAQATIHARAPVLAYVTVPYHPQITGYYCGPASLEMVFDFYGPDVNQREIAEVARTTGYGTYTCDILRAAHFSNISTSIGPAMPGNITGYTTRKLGYAAFEYWGMTIEELKPLIDAGYPVLVCITGHCLVAVGYSSTRILFQDPLAGQNYSMTYRAFARVWYWSLFVCPWQVEVHVPSNVLLGSVFNVTASITYPWYPPFPTDQYPASLSNATVKLPAGLHLVPGEPAKKTIATGFLTAGTSANVTWIVRADSPANYTISVEAEGKVAGIVPSYPEPYSYEDRIGGFNQSRIEVIPTISWEHVFEDERRDTMLKISTDDKQFQFIAPEKEFSVKRDLDMILTDDLLFIYWRDDELVLWSLVVATPKGSRCVAIAMDVETGTRYRLVDSAQ